ncbi:Transposable element Tcb1 transposase [Anthophora quadrimaculata]
MKSIAPNCLKKVISLLNDGLSTRKTAKNCSVSQSTVQRIRKKYCKSILLNVGGRPKKLSPQNERFVTSGEASSAIMAAKLLKEDTNIQISQWTAQRTLKGAEFRSIKKKKKPMLSKKNIKRRLEFAKKYRNWTTTDWERVIWSDKTKINRICSDGMSWCWIRKNERLKPRHVKQTLKHGGGSLMFWGCLTAFGVGSLHRINGIMNQYLYKDILQDHLVDAVENMPFEEKNVIFMHDRDPKHTAKSVKNWLSTKKFSVLDWPAQSPDLNPIENLWGLLKRRLRDSYDSQPTSITDLYNRIQEQWEQISPDYCKKLVESMPKRISAVLQAKGLWTKY